MKLFTKKSKLSACHSKSETVSINSSRTKVRTVSLFSGCGGSDLALSNLGFNVVWANDIWDLACNVYKDNIPNAKIFCGNIADVKKFPKAQLLVGCYPCQGYSQGGVRDIEDERNFLYRHFDRALRAIRPKAFVVENVNGMAYGGNHKLLENQLIRYRSAGYRVKWSVLNAQDYGVAQFRRRIFLVGIRRNLNFEYNFPDPTHGPQRKYPYVSQREAIGELTKQPQGEFNTEKFHWYYLSRNRRRSWGEPSPCIVGHWRHVPLHPSSPPLKRLGPDEWKFTSKKAARRLSFRECAALQGFPQSYIWNHGRIRDKFQMIGNAVPPTLFEKVIEPLKTLWN